MAGKTLRKPSASLPRLRLGHITSGYLASCLRHSAQIRPSGELQIPAAVICNCHLKEIGIKTCQNTRKSKSPTKEGDFMKNCPKCGTPQNEGLNFCTNCGYALTQQKQPQPIREQTMDLQNSQPQQPPQPIGQPTEQPQFTPLPVQPQMPQAQQPQAVQMPGAAAQPVFQQTTFQHQQPQASSQQTGFIAQPPIAKKSNTWLGVSAVVNIVLVAFIILQIAFTPLSFSNDNEEDERYEELNRKYGKLEIQYNSLQSNISHLQSNYNQLQSNYGNLQWNYDLLESQYNSSEKECQFLHNINVGHLMECCYADIREIYEEQWDGFWWQIIGDDEDVITFAANLAEHDLGRLYWIDANDKYNSLRDQNMPENMNQAALTKLSHVPDYIEIKENDSPVTKVEKILDFVTSWVHYEHDTNEVFLSPIETLTFRSGDCDDSAILVSALFELVGLEAGIVFVTNDEGGKHAMTLLHLDDLGGYGHYYFQDLTDHGFKEGKWILIEPQDTIENQANEGWMEQWSGEYFIEIEKHVD